MTIPAPRETTDGGGDMPTAVLSMITDGIREVKEAVQLLSRDMNEQLSKMPETYVSRREFDRYRDERSVEWSAARQQHDADVAELRRQREAEEAARTVGRRWLVGLAVGTAMSMGGVLSGVVLHFT